MILNATVDLVKEDANPELVLLNVDWLTDIINTHASEFSPEEKGLFHEAWAAFRDTQARVAVYIDEAEVDVVIITSANQVKILAKSAFMGQREVFTRIAREGDTIVRYESLSSKIPILEIGSLGELASPYIDWDEMQDALSENEPKYFEEMDI